MDKKPTIEYRDLTPELESVRTVVTSNGDYLLTHHTEGYEPAGSAMRWTKGGYAVMTNSIPAHGRREMDKLSACELYRQWTGRKPFSQTQDESGRAIAEMNGEV